MKCWLRYLEHKHKATKDARFNIFERAVKQLPGRLVVHEALHDWLQHAILPLMTIRCCSHKLWAKYLAERRKAVVRLSPTDPVREEVNRAYERARVFMHKMPRIWLDYLQVSCCRCACASRSKVWHAPPVSRSIWSCNDILWMPKGGCWEMPNVFLFVTLVLLRPGDHPWLHN